jgi:CRISPR system Cascade subunit CasE
MFLSKLILNPRSSEARRDATAPYELHRTLARAFSTAPSTDYRAEHGVLFRIEPLAHRDAQPTVLVQSRTEPDWSSLPEQYAISAKCNSFDIKFAAGQTLQFRLVVNPTRKEKREGQKQGRRVALPDYLNKDAEADAPTPAQEWLSRKGLQHGFEVLWASSDDFWHGAAKGNTATSRQTIPLYGVRFDGMLRVTDPALFDAALRTGIGPAKAFGFGLLSLSRAKF